MRVLRLALVLIVLLLPAAGCDDSSQILGRPRGEALLIFDNGFDASAAASVAPAQIREVSVRDSRLFLELDYNGGCGDHRFALHGSRAFLESLPPQAVLIVSHHDGGEGCATPASVSLVFDLGELEQVFRETYGHDGPLELRIFAPGSIDPVLPLPVFDF